MFSSGLALQGSKEERGSNGCMHYSQPRHPYVRSGGLSARNQVPDETSALSMMFALCNYNSDPPPLFHEKKTFPVIFSNTKGD